MTISRRYLAPPAGRQVRRLIAILTLAVGIPRLPLVEDLVTFAPQRFGAPEVYGIACVLVGVLLMATAYELRLTLWGRTAAGLAFVLWATLAFATTSATSLLIDAAVAVSLLVETSTMRDA